MSLTFIASTTGCSQATGDANNTGMASNSTLNVAAGDLLVCFVKWEGGSTTITSLQSGAGQNAFTFDAGDTWTYDGTNDAYGAMGYVLAAAANATATFTLTLAAARPWKRFIIFQFRPDAGETVTKKASNKGSGNSASLNSGSITTTGSGLDGVALGFFGEYSSTTTSSEQINGVARDGRADCGTNVSFGFWVSGWYKFYTAGFTGAATATITSGPWGCGIIAFESAAGGGGGGSTPSIAIRRTRSDEILDDDILARRRRAPLPSGAAVAATFPFARRRQPSEEIADEVADRIARVSPPSVDAPPLGWWGAMLDESTDLTESIARRRMVLPAGAAAQAFVPLRRRESGRDEPFSEDTPDRLARMAPPSVDSIPGVRRRQTEDSWSEEPLPELRQRGPLPSATDSPPLVRKQLLRDELLEDPVSRLRAGPAPFTPSEPPASVVFGREPISFEAPPEEPLIRALRAVLPSGAAVFSGPAFALRRLPEDALLPDDVPQRARRVTPPSVALPVVNQPPPARLRVQPETQIDDLATRQLRALPAIAGVAASTPLLFSDRQPAQELPLPELAAALRPMPAIPDASPFIFRRAQLAVDQALEDLSPRGRELLPPSVDTPPYALRRSVHESLAEELVLRRARAWTPPAAPVPSQPPFARRPALDEMVVDHVLRGGPRVSPPSVPLPPVDQPPWRAPRTIQEWLPEESSPERSARFAFVPAPPMRAIRNPHPVRSTVQHGPVKVR